MSNVRDKIWISDQLAKRGLEAIAPKVKKFLRAYHEMRGKRNDTKYVPKFDDYVRVEPGHYALSSTWILGPTPPR